MKIEIQKSKFKIKELFFISFTFSIFHFAFLLFPLHSYGDLDKTLNDLEERQKGIETYEADFIQTKVLSIMTSKISSEGHIYFKRPNLINWRYIKGSNLLMVFNGNEAWLYYPNLKEAERYKNIERIIKKFPLAFGLDVKDLRRYWDISLIPASQEGIIAIELRPKAGEKERIFERMTLWIEENKGVPKRVQIFETGGDYTLIEFKRIRINEELPPDIFIFKPPEGVKVTSPLE